MPDGHPCRIFGTYFLKKWRNLGVQDCC